MTDQRSGLRAISTALAVLLAIPAVLMLVVLPVLGLVGLSHIPSGGAGWQMLMPVIPGLVLGSIVYLLYAAGHNGKSASEDGIEALRRAYARGELSDKEFDARRARLDGAETAGSRSEGVVDE